MGKNLQFILHSYTASARSPAFSMQKSHSFDLPLFFAVFWLIAFGTIMISSVSIYASYKLTTGLVSKWILEEASNSFYLYRHLINAIIALTWMFVVANIPYRFIERSAKYFFFGTVLMLLFTFIPGIWALYNGARWWLDLPWLPSIQPIEFVKIWLILYLSVFLKKRYSRIASLEQGFLPYFWIYLIIALPLALLPDFWSILIITPLVIALYYLGWWNVRFLGISILIACIGAISIYSIGKSSDPESPGRLSYISARFDRFMRSANEVATSTNDGDFQLKQWLIAIGSGGWWGLWFWKSIQKYGYLPEVQWDFIFSVIVEELWLNGAILLIAIYLFIVYRGYMIARGLKDPFAHYTAFGISTLIGIQAMVNMGVNLNVIPLTGVTLPFVSYGWSSLISLILWVGILLSLSKHTNNEMMKQMNFTIFWSKNTKRIVQR